MNKNNRFRVFAGAAIFAVGLIVGINIGPAGAANAQSSDRVFELRTYITHAGRLDALHARFANHTMRLFERHGMTNIGYFTPQDSPESENTLIYVLAHDSREAAKESWSAFVSDPEWQEAYKASRADGDIIESLTSVFMDATEYSQMK